MPAAAPATEDSADSVVDFIPPQEEEPSPNDANNDESNSDNSGEIAKCEPGILSNGSQDTVSTDGSLDDDDDFDVFGGNFPHDIHEKYILMEDVLGEGSFGTVRKCRNKSSGEVHALKTIDKSKLPDATQLRREVDILLSVDHHHIIKLYDVYEDASYIYLVSELCSGGELYDRVVQKTTKEGCFSEYGAARIIKNILSAIAYCHDVKKIVHRDLKPENFLLTDKTDNAQVKVIDFGLSRYSADRMQSCVGTIYYVAPEVLFGEYTSKADIWSIGVVAYVLLCGFPPFNAGSEGLTYNVVKEGKLKFPSPAWDKISPEAIGFVKKLMDRDPDRRPSAAEAMEDPWVNQELVNPHGKWWHGTFLSKDTKEFQATQEKLVVHTDRNRRALFQKDYSTRQLTKQKRAKRRVRRWWKKQENGITEMLPD